MQRDKRWNQARAASERTRAVGDFKMTTKVVGTRIQYSGREPQARPWFSELEMRQKQEAFEAGPAKQLIPHVSTDEPKPSCECRSVPTCGASMFVTCEACLKLREAEWKAPLLPSKLPTPDEFTPLGQLQALTRERLGIPSSTCTCHLHPERQTVCAACQRSDRRADLRADIAQSERDCRDAQREMRFRTAEAHLNRADRWRRELAKLDELDGRLASLSPGCSDIWDTLPIEAELKRIEGQMAANVSLFGINVTPQSQAKYSEAKPLTKEMMVATLAELRRKWDEPQPPKPMFFSPQQYAEFKAAFEIEERVVRSSDLGFGLGTIPIVVSEYVPSGRIHFAPKEESK